MTDNLILGNKNQFSKSTKKNFFDDEIRKTGTRVEWLLLFTIFYCVWDALLKNFLDKNGHYTLVKARAKLLSPLKGLNLNDTQLPRKHNSSLFVRFNFTVGHM